MSIDEHAYEILVRFERYLDDDMPYIERWMNEEAMSRREAASHQFHEELRELAYFEFFEDEEFEDACEVVDVVFPGEQRSVTSDDVNPKGDWWIWNANEICFQPWDKESSLENKQRFVVRTDDQGVPKVSVHINNAYVGLLIRMATILSEKYGVCQFMGPRPPRKDEYCGLTDEDMLPHKIGYADADSWDDNMDCEADVTNLDTLEVEIMVECADCGTRGYATLKRRDFDWR